jgi:hypothetical protein
MDKLAPKLIRRAARKQYIAVVIDPIYKVITGDENSADQMAHFCNQFDKVCTELGCAVIYCHHHSKGAQGGKRSMDRASGSGVFARDPDALLDFIELLPTESIIKQAQNDEACRVMGDALKRWGLLEEVSQDDLCSNVQMRDACRRLLDNERYKCVMADVTDTEKSVLHRTAWRIEGTLREYPKFAPINVWFDFPVHRVDKVGILRDMEAEIDKTSWQKNFKKKKSQDDLKKERLESLETQFASLKSFADDGVVTLKSLAESMGITEKTARNRIKEHGGFWIDDGTVGKK